MSSISYENTQIRDGDVVYADPPYANTRAAYNNGFDHDKFWEWVRTRNFPVYVSEYNAPEDFVSVWSKKKRKLGKGGLSGYKGNEAIEHIFLHKKWL